MNHHLIPTPKTYTELEGTLTLAPRLFSKHSDFALFFPAIANATEKIFNRTLTEGEGGILLEKDDSLPSGAYVCDFSASARLCAADTEGMRSALATLLQLLTAEGEGFTLPRVRIEDHPEKTYRTLMVDLARVWHPFPTLKHYVEICFFLKLNYLHLHLIDDPGYRLPSRAFPKLPTPGFHYTEEEIAELNAYARAHGVTLIPEIEGPGHARSLNEGYREIFGNRPDTESAEDCLVTENGDVIRDDSLICAGRKEAMDGLAVIVREVCAMFPDSPYIHIGGDEASIQLWNSCPDCRAYMKEHGIEDVYELYSDFVGRFAQLVLDEGRTPIVWEGFPKKGVSRIPKGTVVIAWESHYHMAYDLIDEGFTVINGSWQPLYIVPSLNHRWDPYKILDWDVYNLQHWWPKSEARLNPIHLTPTEQVIGAQISMWETSYEDSVARIMENCAAMVERLWTVRRVLSKDDFSFVWTRRVLPKLRLLIREDAK